MNIEELKQQYYKSKENDDIIELAPRVHGYQNEGIRRDLQKQADLLLTEPQQLAIYIHTKKCKANHTDGCSWYYDIKDLEHDWTSYTHKEYLKKAIGVLDILDFETAKKVVDQLFEK